MRYPTICFIVLALTLAIPSNSQRPIIIDVDAGIDDYQALVAFLNADKEKLVKIEAIICTYGITEIDHIKVNVMRLLETINRTDINVYLGSNGFIFPKKLTKWFGEDGFGDITYAKEPDLSSIKEEIAPVALNKIFSDNPGNVTLVNVGPLTNIALALRMYKDLGSKIKEIYIMGGNYNVSEAEYNFMSDAEAVQIVLNSTNIPIKLLTWQACSTVKTTYKWRLGIKIHNPVFEIVDKPEQKIYASADPESQYISCDSVLAELFLSEEIATYYSCKYSAEMELCDPKTKGQMIINDGVPNINIIESVHTEKFKKKFIDTFTNVCKLYDCKDIF